MKCHEHLHLLVRFDRNCTDHIFEQGYNLDIFEQIASTNEPTKEFVKRELLVFKKY
jgi:hypothetical protein